MNDFVIKFDSRAKVMIQKLVQKVGFAGILACASIPNPLFDLAGLTCGHFLVPFWTFFGATVLGKAVVKMHLQKMFVIVAFNETLVGYVMFISHMCHYLYGRYNYYKLIFFFNIPDKPYPGLKKYRT